MEFHKNSGCVEVETFKQRYTRARTLGVELGGKCLQINGGHTMTMNYATTLPHDITCRANACYNETAVARSYAHIVVHMVLKMQTWFEVAMSQ